jgi:hypothetical protein
VPSLLLSLFLFFYYLTFSISASGNILVNISLSYLLY